MNRFASHIAALVAVAASLVSVAAVEEVKFDADRTNETNVARWEYRSGFEYGSGNNGYYFRNRDGRVLSPTFPFAVTSVTVSARTSSVAPGARRLMVSARESAAGVEDIDITPSVANAKTDVDFGYDLSAGVRALDFYIVSSNTTGSIYLYSAVIRGAPLCPAPMNLTADPVHGTRFTLNWENGEGVVSNRVDMMKIVDVPEQGEVTAKIDFYGLSNATATTVQFTDISNSYPGFYGELLYLPADSAGVVQISKSSGSPGYLEYGIPSLMEDTTLFVSARKPAGAPKKYDLGISTANTNITVSLDYDFATNSVYLGSLDSGSSVRFGPTDTGSGDRRILVDMLCFVSGYAAGYSITNTMPSQVVGRNRAKMNGLNPLTRYVAVVTAFDAEGNASDPSDEIDVTTKAGNMDTLILIR